MTKFFKMRNVIAIAICLAGITVFSGCSKDDDPKETGKPGAVMNFTATAGDGQVSLSWVAPSNNGGSDITGYEVTKDNWASKETKTASQLSHTYTGLTNGTLHTFKVRAINANGAGVESTATATPGSVTQQLDEKLILPDGQAWVMQDITTSGYIFKANGTYVYYDGTWQPQSNGTWSTNGNKLTIVQTGISPYNYTYNVSGGKLTMTNPFGDVYVYNQMSIPGGDVAAEAIQAIAQQLANTSKGGSPNDLEPVTLSIDMKIINSTAGNWAPLMEVLVAAGKYITLDLSGSTMSLTSTFNLSSSTGTQYIVELILPATATTIGENSFYHTNGQRFPNLTKVTGQGITLIDIAAFGDHEKITTVVFPNLVSIPYQAFGINPALADITIGANCNISDNVAPTTRFATFRTYYEANGKQAGRYTWNGSAWTK